MLNVNEEVRKTRSMEEEIKDRYATVNAMYVIIKDEMAVNSAIVRLITNEISIRWCFTIAYDVNPVKNIAEYVPSHINR